MRLFIKKILKSKTWIITFILLLASALISAGVVFFNFKDDYKIVRAGTTDNVSGFAWSENIGWISFNSTDCDTDGDGTYEGASEDGGAAPAGCPTSGTVNDYGVNINSSTGDFIDPSYAWSENIGWINFAPPSDTGTYPVCGYPEAPCNSAKLDVDSGIVYGWAKIETLGDDGWLLLGSDPSGLVLYQSFDTVDISGSTAIDRSGQGNDGTITGATAAAMGQFGQALDFDGTDDYVDAGSPNFGISGFTYCVWIYPEALTGSHVILHYNNAADNDSLGLRVVSTGFIDMFDGNGSFGETVTPIIEDNWYHICFTSDSLTDNGINDTTNAYINGTLDNTKVWSYNPYLASDHFYISNPIWGNIKFNGLIDEVRVYNRALSLDEIKQLYFNGVRIHPSSGDFTGWAWNGNAAGGAGIGWVSFNSNACDSDGDGFIDPTIYTYSISANTLDSINGYVVSTRLNNGNIMVVHKQSASPPYYKSNIVDKNGGVLSEIPFGSEIYNSYNIAALDNGNAMYTARFGSWDYGRYIIFDENSVVIKGPEYIGDTDPYYISSRPSITSFNNGNVLIAYTRSSPVGVSYEIRDRIGDLTIGPINFDTSSDSKDPYTSLLADGNILITWGISDSRKSKIIAPDGSISPLLPNNLGDHSENILHAPLANGKAIVINASSNGGQTFIVNSDGSVNTAEVSFYTSAIKNVSVANLTNYGSLTDKIIITFTDPNDNDNGYYVIIDSNNSMVLAPENFAANVGENSVASTDNGGALISYFDKTISSEKIKFAIVNAFTKCEGEGGSIAPYKVHANITPDAPTSLTATEQTCTAMKLDWNQVSWNNGYEAEYDDGLGWKTFCSVSQGINYCNSFMSENATWNFRVKTLGIGGNDSTLYPASGGILGTTDYCPPVLIVDNSNCDSVKLNWTYGKLSDDHYEIWRDKDGAGFGGTPFIDNIPPAETSTTTYDIISGSSYSYYVKAETENKDSNIVGPISPCPSLPTWIEVK